MLRSFTCILITLIFISCSGNHLETKLDSYLNPLVENNLFSGSILIAKRGDILVSKGYGLANREHDVPNTSTTKFRLGSITKQFTAVAILKLQEGGLLSTEDKISQYIHNAPISWSDVTIHHLLTHTSGMPNFTSSSDYEKLSKQGMTIYRLIDHLCKEDLDFIPGQRFSYSNSGYVILGYIIEKVSGLSFEVYLREKILKPNEMMNTGYDVHDKIILNRASGYNRAKENAEYIDMSIPHAAGALYSTVEDLYLWDRLLYTESLISKQSIEQMFTPNLSDYGYGWRIVKNDEGHLITEHRGGINGFHTYIARNISNDTVIIILSNLEVTLSGVIQTIQKHL